MIVHSETRVGFGLNSLTDIEILNIARNALVTSYARSVAQLRDDRPGSYREEIRKKSLRLKERQIAELQATIDRLTQDEV